MTPISGIASIRIRRLAAILVAAVAGLGFSFPAPCQAPASDSVHLELTFPAGASPKVFTEGWVFGAVAIVNLGTANQRAVSNDVQWSGSGTFTPQTGLTSRPRFAKAGPNTITLTLVVDGRRILKSYTVDAVSPYDRNGMRLYAVLGDRAICPSHSHSCPRCPHLDCMGPITSGSPNVSLKGPLGADIPAARAGDRGVHALCCGPNTFEIIGGDPQVLIDGKPAARFGDVTSHCDGAGMGTIVPSAAAPPPPSGPQYVSSVREYRDPANPNRAGWIVTEERGRQLTIHVGNDDASFQALYIRIHGEQKWNALGFARWTRIGRSWQDALNEAERIRREWLSKNDRLTLPPAESSVLSLSCIRIPDR